MCATNTLDYWMHDVVRAPRHLFKSSQRRATTSHTLHDWMAQAHEMQNNNSACVRSVVV